ncbi:hypothetical protein EYZ11_010977 [Aspergillus tanneri]|uniref:Uncharacterized protein n=1 Tax=Aspergillus tanneri TaxID=1220188 RepID=A0A4S3J646_9EURO|nr:hypothetical protein EYZ11_010977 [Aspergillus tanneri]
MTPMGAVLGSLNLFHTEVDVYTPVYGPDLMSDCGPEFQKRPRAKTPANLFLYEVSGGSNIPISQKAHPTRRIQCHIGNP